MSKPPEPRARADEPHGVLPKAGRAASLSLACLLFVGAAGAVFAACALWQAGVVVQALLDMTEAAPRSATPSPAAAKVEPDAPRVMTKAAGERSQPGASVEFEKRAEASEKAIPLGLEATLNEADEALPLGEPPPPGFPRSRCEGIFVYIVTTAEGAPLRSAASLAFGKSGRARLRQPGERFGDWTVLAITDDWSGLNPEVWLEKDGKVCRAELAGNPDRLREPPKPRPRASPRRRRGKR